MGRPGLEKLFVEYFRNVNGIIRRLPNQCLMKFLSVVLALEQNDRKGR
jgi:hypothetical protein